jgi:hypothetical protein
MYGKMQNISNLGRQSSDKAIRPSPSNKQANKVEQAWQEYFKFLINSLGDLSSSTYLINMSKVCYGIVVTYFD